MDMQKAPGRWDNPELRCMDSACMDSEICQTSIRCTLSCLKYRLHGPNVITVTGRSKQSLSCFLQNALHRGKEKGSCTQNA